MGKLQKLQCDNCGGHIDGSSLRCQMCGMQYKLDEDFTLGRIEIYNGRFITLEGMIAVPGYALYEFGDKGPEMAAEMTLKALSRKMAEKMLPFMDFRQYFDPRTMTLETRAEVRVAEPRLGNFTSTVDGFDTIARWHNG